MSSCGAKCRASGKNTLFDHSVVPGHFLNRDWYKPAVLLMWLALPLSAFQYWRAWDQLPMRMAVHFDVNWQPNGYTSREGALMLGFGIMVVMLLLFTVAGLIVRAQKPAAAWPMLVVFLCGARFSVVRKHLDCGMEPEPAVIPFRVDGGKIPSGT